MFEVSKVNSGNIELNPVELNVVALIQQAQAETEDLLKQNNLTVILDAPENGIVQALDGDKTYRILKICLRILQSTHCPARGFM